MRFINNIQTVSRYESKLLMRSWFFRIAVLLVVFVFSIWDLSFLLGEITGGWASKAIPSNVLLLHLLILNTGQAIIAIFLASDFLKRERKLDTSEVFLVRSLSNAEYVIGKIWGNLRIFILLNLIVMGMSALCSFLATGGPVDWAAYPVYFLLMSVPTLIYIIGLSVFLMLVVKNQALTLLLLLAYVGFTLFYAGDGFYAYLFDYITIYLPLVKSTIVGFTNIETILMQRSIYLLGGLAFIFSAIFLFDRLPNTSRSNYAWAALAVVMGLLCGITVYRYVDRIKEQDSLRSAYIATNKAYNQASNLKIDRYDIKIEQHPHSFAAEAQLQGVALSADSIFPLCLNPSLTVEAVREAGQSLSFARDRQMIRIRFGRKIAEGDTLSFVIHYSGRLDQTFCYLDIPGEEMNKANTVALFNSDKQYLFQTPSYLLLTPESYWYPRPLMESFSRFTLQVRPLQGLVVLSQGEGILRDGAYTFAPEYPLRALSLVAGKYRQESVVSDSVVYSLWTIEGDPLSSSFGAIRDTIPALIRNFREDMERKFRLTYPLKRLSVIETPAQFYSYPRAGSQAQEMMQPEIVFFPERGWRHTAFDVDKGVERKIAQAQRNGQSMNEKEAQISLFNDLLRTLSRPVENYDYVSSGRGEWDVVAKANPYFVYPQLYNFRYHVFSADWPVANYLLEQYLQNETDNLSSSDREREIIGVSQQEKANLLMEQYSFREILADASRRDLANPLIALKASRLFAPAEVRTGISAFRDSLHAVMERNTFHNISFEDLLDTLSRISRTDLLSGINEWNRPTLLPLYHIRPPEVVQYTNRGQETFVMKITLSNDSNNDGFVRLSVQDDRRSEQTGDVRMIALPARRSKQLVSILDHAPRSVTFHTGVSGNLPNVIHYAIPNIRQERGAPADREGDYLLPKSLSGTPDEVIVDNEDAGLFELSEAPVGGLLPKWLNRMEATIFPYAGVSRRLPLRWTATTHSGYYGTYIRSAYVIRNGNGNQTATWKVPIPSPGHYDVYYYMSDVYQQNRRQAEYRFRVLYDGESEDTYLNLKTAGEGWMPIGAYYFASDTIRIVLTNECEWRKVSADAVRVVKR
jgi:ABC-type transport system involved in multi-copper enzyme maturation permease subunit